MRQKIDKRKFVIVRIYVGSDSRFRFAFVSGYVGGDFFNEFACHFGVGELHAME